MSALYYMSWTAHIEKNLLHAAVEILASLGKQEKTKLEQNFFSNLL